MGPFASCSQVVLFLGGRGGGDGGGGFVRVGDLEEVDFLWGDGGGEGLEGLGEVHVEFCLGSQVRD